MEGGARCTGCGPIYCVARAGGLRGRFIFDAVAESMVDGGPPERELVTERVHVVHVVPVSPDPRGPARRLHEGMDALVADGLEAGDVTRRHEPDACRRSGTADDRRLEADDGPT